MTSQPLVLIPTDVERNRICSALPDAFDLNASVELCGFGPVAAAARAAFLLSQLQPTRVVLVGIAGAYCSKFQLGQAASFESVACHGIGIGESESHRSAADAGWPQWPGQGNEEPVGDLIELQPGPNPLSGLLTCTTSSANTAEADSRIKRHPAAVAEDMEGFGVALACRMYGTPCTIIRGASNQAGDRDHSRWRIDESLDAVAEALRIFLDN